MIRGRDHKERVRDIVSSLMLFCREEEEKRTQTVMILFYVLPKKGFMEGTFFFLCVVSYLHLLLIAYTLKDHINYDMFRTLVWK